MRGRISVNFVETVGKIDPRIYGHFAEQMGGVIYGGMWVGEESEIPNTKGWRNDVIELVRAIRPPIIRWPGGNFSEFYHWRDGVGPVAERPRNMDWMWLKPEPNWVGTHEFIDFCRMVGAEPMITLNIRTCSPEEAADWVRYCNASTDTPLGRERAKNRHPEPFRVKYWDIGNEEWDLGVEESARRFIAFTKEMKEADPEIEVVAVGSACISGNQNLDWDRKMIKRVGRYMDHIAPHYYDGVRTPDPKKDKVKLYYANIASGPRIIGMLCSYVKMLNEMLPDRPEVGIAMDEWGSWTHPDDPGRCFYVNRNLSDALVVASVFNGLHHLCQRVKMANITMMVNVMGGLIQTTANWPDVIDLKTGKPHTAFCTPIYYAFRLYRNLCGSEAVPVETDSPTFDSSGEFENVFRRRVKAVKAVPFLDAAASRDPGRFVLCVVNRHMDEDILTELHLTGLGKAESTMIYTLNGPDVFVFNTFQNPEAVVVTEDKMSCIPKKYVFPAHSLTVLTIE